MLDLPRLGPEAVGVASLATHTDGKEGPAMKALEEGNDLRKREV
jgi:hypothetical protein